MVFCFSPQVWCFGRARSRSVLIGGNLLGNWSVLAGVWKTERPDRRRKITWLKSLLLFCEHWFSHTHSLGWSQLWKRALWGFLFRIWNSPYLTQNERVKWRRMVCDAFGFTHLPVRYGVAFLFRKKWNNPVAAFRASFRRGFKKFFWIMLFRLQWNYRLFQSILVERCWCDLSEQNY